MHSFIKPYPLPNDPPLSPVTVLMPAYNAGAYIESAISSILGQTFRDFELLIIDDASGDNTVQLIQSFDDQRIRLLKNKQNIGIQKCLNLGIAEASFDLIARMDADDISHPWRLAKQVDFMLQNPDCAMIATQVHLIDKQGMFIRTEGMDSRFFYYALNFECCLFHPTILFRKTAAIAIGGYQLPYAEDYDFFWRMARQFKIGGIDEPLLQYRIHDHNTNLVGKREEYAQYTLSVVQRNIQYFLGNLNQLNPAYIECFRYHFTPLLQLNSMEEINQCLNLLDKISNEIVSTENPNRNLRDLNFIIAYKKQYILLEIAKKLPYFKSLRLLHSRSGYRFWAKLAIERTKILFHKP